VEWGWIQGEWHQLRVTLPVTLLIVLKIGMNLYFSLEKRQKYHSRNWNSLYRHLNNYCLWVNC
jgi:uncharacterized membrane protein